MEVICKFQMSTYQLLFLAQIQDRNEMGVAICLQTNVNVKCTTRSLEFALVWHMPVVHFGGKERIYRK